MTIRITMTVNHDATDPDANDTTMDMNDPIFENLFKGLENVELIEKSRQFMIVQFDVPCANPALYHVED